MFLESCARVLVLLHTLTAIVLIGAATHHAMVVRKRRPNLRLCRVYGCVSAVAYLATLALGALAYPSYRYYVRGLYLDRHAVWASKLFEIKEDLAMIGALVAVGVWILGRAAPFEGSQKLGIYTVLVWVVPVIVWFNVVSGLLITMVRGV